MILCQTSVNNIYCAMEIFFLEEKKGTANLEEIGLQPMKKIHLKYDIRQTKRNNIYCAVEIFFLKEKKGTANLEEIGLQSMKKIHLKYDIGQTKRNNIYCAVEIFFFGKRSKKKLQTGRKFRFAVINLKFSNFQI